MSARIPITTCSVPMTTFAASSPAIDIRRKRLEALFCVRCRLVRVLEEYWVGERGGLVLPGKVFKYKDKEGDVWVKLYPASRVDCDSQTQWLLYKQNSTMRAIPVR